MVGDFSGISNWVDDRSPMTPTVVQPLYNIYTVSQKKLCKIVSIRTLSNFYQF